MWLQRPAKFQPTLQRRITSSILRNNNDSSKRWCHSMSNEMFKTVIPNVFYVMHILKLTFILNFALIGQLNLTNQKLFNENLSCTFQVQQYVAAPILICPDLNSVLTLDHWACQKGQKWPLLCSWASSSGHFEEIGHFLGCSSSNFGGSKTIKSRWAENQKIWGFKWIWFILMTHLSNSYDSKYMSLICLVNITMKLYYIQKQKIQ